MLVNPLAPSATAAVYRAFDEDRACGPTSRRRPATDLATVADVVGWLRETRNDLQGPATRLRPEIGEVLHALNRDGDYSAGEDVRIGRDLFRAMRR